MDHKDFSGSKSSTPIDKHRRNTINDVSLPTGCRCRSKETQCMQAKRLRRLMHSLCFRYGQATHSFQLPKQWRHLRVDVGLPETVLKIEPKLFEVWINYGPFLVEGTMTIFTKLFDRCHSDFITRCAYCLLVRCANRHLKTCTIGNAVIPTKPRHSEGRGALNKPAKTLKPTIRRPIVKC